MVVFVTTRTGALYVNVNQTTSELIVNSLWILAQHTLVGMVAPVLIEKVHLNVFVPVVLVVSSVRMNHLAQKNVQKTMYATMVNAVKQISLESNANT